GASAITVEASAALDVEARPSLPCSAAPRGARPRRPPTADAPRNCRSSPALAALAGHGPSRATSVAVPSSPAVVRCGGAPPATVFPTRPRAVPAPTQPSALPVSGRLVLAPRISDFPDP